MPTPLGHALAGMAAGTAASGGRTILGPVKDLAFFVGFGVLADIDFIPGLIFGQGAAWHRGISHSITAAAVAGLLAWLWARRKPGGGWLALGALAAYASHILLDFLNVDTRPPFGIPLLWPFSGEYMLAHHAIFPDVKRHALTWAIVKHDLVTMAWETLLLGPPALAALLWRRAKQRRSKGRS
ncbi:MAG: metal-dependent hydrolase [Deltaproteobacteria bacterium]|nr:metal-dependent hydrolase [Deltaproteobacteria bacterium]